MQPIHSAISNEKEYLVQTYSRPPFVLVRGEGATLYDEHGKAYGDKGVAQAMQQQLETGIIHTSNLYHSEPHAALAKMLVEKSFADRVFFSNSGTEANEGALKFARRVAYDSGNPDKTQVVTFSHAFHGRTLASLSLTPKEKYQAPFKPLMPDVVLAEYNDIESARAAINDNTAAMILEPIQGEGGIHAATPEFLQAVRQLCDEHKAILIFDEVQCGMGRTGDLWAHTASGITPDIMTLAKPL